MPKTAAATVSQLQDTAMNPVQNVAGGLRVNVDLIFDGVAFNPANLINALVTQYGAGKVSADTDVAAKNNYRFRIIP